MLFNLILRNKNNGYPVVFRNEKKNLANKKGIYVNVTMIIY